MTGEKSPAELLREEHQSVLQKLDALEAAINNLEQKEKISAKLKEQPPFLTPSSGGISRKRRRLFSRNLIVSCHGIVVPSE